MTMRFTPEIEKLDYDLTRTCMSSQSKFKSGKNQGYCKAESDGDWKYITGFCEHSRHDVKASHWNWVNKLVKLNHRIGVHYEEGCSNFYIFISDQVKNML